MNDDELKKKMDELGLLMNSLMNAQCEFDGAHAEQERRIGDLREELRAEFLKRGTGMKSQCLEVRYRRGIARWDTSWLDGYSIDHPELRKFRQEGQPTVAFILRDEGWENESATF